MSDVIYTIILKIQGPITSRELLIGNDSTFNHWQYIVDRLNTLLIKMKENFVCALFIPSYFSHKC